MRCPICRERAPEVGVLCEECRDELASPMRISPEQIQGRVQGPTDGALLDLWGRIHRLEPRTLIGRQIDSFGLSILEPSVSRHHAHLTLDNNVWTVRDLGSANGTFQDDKLVEAPVEIGNGTRVRFGHIAFYLVYDASVLPSPRMLRTVANTIRPFNLPPHSVGGSAARPSRAGAFDLPPHSVGGSAGRPSGPGTGDTAMNSSVSGAPNLSPLGVSSSAVPASDFDGDDDEEQTTVGLPEMRFRLHEPTGGGGGLIEVDNKQVQLTTTQFELMSLMIRRMASERHQPELVRGFVRSSELIADLSWDTREPSENHVKQLVRRVRRALMKSEIGDLIESRHRFGYRLRAIPKAD